MIASRAAHDFARAIAAIDATHATPIEKVEMLVEMALDLQRRPKTPDELQFALSLHDRALALCPADEALLIARVRVHKASALRAVPGASLEPLLLARAELEGALPVLSALGASSEEVGVAEMSLGVVLQTLAGARAAKITDAIAAYQRATRHLDRETYPRDFAILQNNLATAYLSIPVTDERAKLREALAVQAYNEALKVVSLVDDPVEYAMLQNNLGNALQYAASGHPIENGLLALAAYDQALQVRNPRNMPLEYANTIANKANCLRNLPDAAVPEADDRTGPGEAPPPGDALSSVLGPSNRRLFESARLYAEALELYRHHGELERASLVEQARHEILQELGERRAPHAGSALDFGQSRI